MRYDFKKEANKLIEQILKEASPDLAVKMALEGFVLPKGNLVLIAIGKAGFSMAKAAEEVLGDKISDGFVITKYGHAKSDLSYVKIREAAHPIPDEAGFKATKEVLDLVEPLNKEDKVLFLISGGGSALFELPLIEPKRLKSITDSLLRCGADIGEINTVRKHLSAVKGGRFAELCFPALVESIILSDVLGDRLDVIASAPAHPDKTTSEEALAVLSKYKIEISDEEKEAILKETPKSLANVQSKIIGSVKGLCKSARKSLEGLGYDVVFLTDRASCEAKELGYFLGNIAQTYSDTDRNLAFVCGGETLVKVKGAGKGGRNQELALAAAIVIKGLDNVALFSLASDGTDGPTDAAGGLVDGYTYEKILESGKKAEDYLENNDSYNALEKADALIKTGATGTNVNDVTVLLIGARR